MMGHPMWMTDRGETAELVTLAAACVASADTFKRPGRVSSRPLGSTRFGR
jgi:hypothetical protein